MPYAKINPTGCGIHKSRAKLRLDFYLSPDEPNYKRYRDTPFHTHFIYPAPDILDSDLKAEIERCLNYFYAFHQHCWDKKVSFIDEWRKVPRVKGSVRDVFTRGNPKELPINQGRVQNILTKAHEFQVGVSKVPTQDLKIGERGTIDIGSAAIGRPAASSTGRTYLVFDNPANADGTVTSVEIWAVENLTNCKVGTFFGSEYAWTSRDSETIGSVTAGSKQTFTSLDITTVTGDLIGIYCVGAVERQPSGYAGAPYKAGDQFGQGQQTYEGGAGDTLSLYGTGTEGAGEHYERSGTALLGLLGSGTRALDVARGDTALLGLLPTAARGLALTRSDTGLLGLKATGTRAVGYIRSKTALLGLKTTATRAIALNRSKTALLGLLATGSRAISLSRSKTALLGLLGTGSRSLALTRAKTALLGLKATGIMSTAEHYIRTGIAYLGLVATGTRSIALGRAGTALLGLKGTAARTIAITRSKTALLGLKVTGFWTGIGRQLVIKVFTLQYRAIKVATSQHRIITAITSQYRKIKTLLLGE